MLAPLKPVRLIGKRPLKTERNRRVWERQDNGLLDFTHCAPHGRSQNTCTMGQVAAPASKDQKIRRHV
jgi:hypothetical protein